MFYMDLSEEQTNNLTYLLSLTNVADLDRLRSNHNFIKKARSLNDYRNNVQHFLMHNTLDIDNFTSWFLDSKLYSNATLIHYELSSGEITRLCSPNSIKQFRINRTHLLNLSFKSLKKTIIFDYIESNHEILLSFVSPATKVKNEGSIEIGTEKNLVEDSLFFSFARIDKSSNSITISIPNLDGYKSIEWEKSSKKFFDFIHKTIIHEIQEISGKLAFLSPSWLTKALRTIALESFQHNNPEISTKLQEINTNLYLDKTLASLSSDLNDAVTIKRIKNAISAVYERELINKLGAQSNPNQVFTVFLHQVEKGVTSFQARHSTKHTNYILHIYHTRDIILKMLENGTITSLGLKYEAAEGVVSYKVTSSDNYFTLEQSNSGHTNKELVKNVLNELKKYKPKSTNNAAGNFKQ